MNSHLIAAFQGTRVFNSGTHLDTRDEVRSTLLERNTEEYEKSFKDITG